MFELFHEMNWTLIGTLVVVSALVAYVGDIVGMKLGKKRISFMKLRPKYTSRVISVLTGVGIALATLLVISATSETVRTALFSMKYVQSQVTNLTAELQKNRQSLEGMEFELLQSRSDLQKNQVALTDVEEKLAEGSKNLTVARKELDEMHVLREKAAQEQKKLTDENTRLSDESKRLAAESQTLQASVTAMRKESEELKEGLQKLREGRIAVFTGEVLSQGVTNASMTLPEHVDQAISTLLENSRGRLAYKFGEDLSAVTPPYIDPESISLVKSEIRKKPGRYLLRLTASSNAVEDERVSAELEMFNTDLIFKKDTLLAEKTFTPGLAEADLEDEVYRVLRELNARAARDGVLRDPITGNVGSIDSAAFVDIVERLASAASTVKLEVYAAEDIYTEGPVRIRFDLKK